MKILRALPPYLVAGFLLAWLIVNADGWDHDMATYHGQILQVWTYYILLSLACLGAIHQALSRR